LALRENTHFGPYLINGTLGKGGMASVYRAYETDLDRLRVSPRNHLVPVSRSIHVGLRCAQDGTRP
jgi:hypothetical protein